jgi:hypothetical protein
VRAAIGAIGKYLARVIGQRIGTGAAVVDVGRGHRDLLDQSRARIGSNMRLEAMRCRAALVLDPTPILIRLTGTGDDRGVDEGARLDPDRLGFQLGGDRLKQNPVQTVGDQSPAKAHKGGALRRRLAARKAAEAAEPGTILERLGQFNV